MSRGNSRNRNQNRGDRGPRVNDSIRIAKVRVVNSDGSQLGILPIQAAIQAAEEQGLDLVEVAPNARPPVCRIMDYGRYKYDKNRKDKENRKKQVQIQTKEIRMRPKISENDFNTKLKKARQCLEKNNKVFVSVVFKGRERAHGDIAREHLNKMAREVEDIAKVESQPKMDNFRMTMTLAPLK